MTVKEHTNKLLMRLCFIWRVSEHREARDGWIGSQCLSTSSAYSLPSFLLAFSVNHLRQWTIKSQKPNHFVYTLLLVVNTFGTQFMFQCKTYCTGLCVCFVRFYYNLLSQKHYTEGNGRSRIPNNPSYKRHYITNDMNFEVFLWQKSI